MIQIPLHLTTLDFDRPLIWNGRSLSVAEFTYSELEERIANLKRNRASVATLISKVRIDLGQIRKFDFFDIEANVRSVEKDLLTLIPFVEYANRNRENVDIRVNAYHDLLKLISTLYNKYKGEAEPLLNSVKANEAKVVVLRKRVQLMTGSIQSMTMQESRVKSKLRQIDGRLRGLDRKISTLFADLMALQQGTYELSGVQSELENYQELLEQKLFRTRDDLEALVKRVADLNIAVAALVADLRDIVQRVIILQNKGLELDDNLGRAGQSLNQISSNLVVLSDFFVVAQAKVDAIENYLSTFIIGGDNVYLDFGVDHTIVHAVPPPMPPCPDPEPCPAGIPLVIDVPTPAPPVVPTSAPTTTTGTPGTTTTGTPGTTTTGTPGTTTTTSPDCTRLVFTRHAGVSNLTWSFVHGTTFERPIDALSPYAFELFNQNEFQVVAEITLWATYNSDNPAFIKLIFNDEPIAPYFVHADNVAHKAPTVEDDKSVQVHPISYGKMSSLKFTANYRHVIPALARYKIVCMGKFPGSNDFGHTDIWRVDGLLINTIRDDRKICGPVQSVLIGPSGYALTTDTTTTNGNNWGEHGSLIAYSNGLNQEVVGCFALCTLPTIQHEKFKPDAVLLVDCYRDSQSRMESKSEMANTRTALIEMYGVSDFTIIEIVGSEECKRLYESTNV